MSRLVMPPLWKLLVEDLGRIEHAEIEARPLLLFVGGNNTGKTYLASLLWGLTALSGDLAVAGRGAAFERSVTWLEERYARREQEPRFEIPKEVGADLVQVMNDTLREQGATLAEWTFNRPGFKVGKIELRDVARRPGGPLRWDKQEEQDQTSTVLRFPETPYDFYIRAENAHLRAFIVVELAKIQLLGVRSLFSRRLMGRRALPVFLPASRTGFMLLYRGFAQQIVGGALIKAGARPTSIPDLTAPAASFIELLLGLRSNNLGLYTEEAAFLEQALGGKLKLQSGGLEEVVYEHTAGQPPLPMELSSSLVTELAPLVLTLRHVQGYDVLLIEEPEAHLHPAVQRRLARVIVRLVRKGLHVWVTTHSENFCQQINNFIKLGAHPRRAEMQQKFGYGEMDYLELDDVGGYQFEAAPGGRTRVTEMRKSAWGLSMPTFNRELAALTDEAMDLEPASRSSMRGRSFVFWRSPACWASGSRP